MRRDGGHGRVGAWVFGLGVLLAVVGCGDRESLATGGRCSLTSECAVPLVCRLERCRRECATQRDCPVETSCVFDAEGLGACQLEEERECIQASDCPSPLVCRFGQCTNACEQDRDCAAGARCVQDPEQGNACIDMAERECSLNSDCPAPLVCAVDHRCREECVTDRDCRDGAVCDQTVEPRVCRRSMPDGGAGADAGGTGADAGTPPPPGASGRIAAGSFHSCRLEADGALACWGDNASGQLGDGTLMDRTTPVAVEGLSVTEVAAGGNHTCARAGERLWCWGANADGQLGDAALPDQQMPVEVSIDPIPDQLALGTSHTCALSSVGEVWCWGDNESGQVGDGTSANDRPTPVRIDLPARAIQVDAGGGHTCAVLSTGSVYCWGRNGDGQLGNGSTDPSPTPGAVLDLAGAVEVVAGSNHTCARLVDGLVRCWGDDFFGQVGDGIPTTTPTTRPTPGVDLRTAAAELGAGVDHTCARLTDATVWCWGGNGFGQIGADPTAVVESAGPWQVMLTDALELGSGEHHNCVRRATDVLCWGRNGDGQLGNGETERAWVPVMVGP